jgi:type IX secretion system PorP/SprF family membrane protein
MSIFTRKLFAFVLVLILAMSAAQAQEIQFSQWYASSLYLNPALAGMESDASFNTNVRSQWSSVSNNNVTSQLSGIVPLISGIERKRHVGGVGLSIFSDVAGSGSIRRSGFRATGAYSKGFGNDLHRISIGGQVGITQGALDLNNTRWPEQYSNALGYDPSVPVTLQGFSNVNYYPIVNAGVFYSYNPSKNYYRAGTSIFSGLAVSNITNPNQSFFDGKEAKSGMIYKYHGGVELHTNAKINFGPQLLVAYTENIDPQINAGLYLNYRLNESPFGLLGGTDLVLGGWYRVQDAFIASIGLSNNNYTVGFSYDATTSSLSSFNSGRGAYELSFSIRNAKDRRRRRFDTPRI